MPLETASWQNPAAPHICSATVRGAMSLFCWSCLSSFLQDSGSPEVLQRTRDLSLQLCVLPPLPPSLPLSSVVRVQWRHKALPSPLLFPGSLLSRKLVRLCVLIALKHGTITGEQQRGSCSLSRRRPRRHRRRRRWRRRRREGSVVEVVEHSVHKHPGGVGALQPDKVAFVV